MQFKVSTYKQTYKIAIKQRRTATACNCDTDAAVLLPSVGRYMQHEAINSRTLYAT